MININEQRKSLLLKKSQTQNKVFKIDLINKFVKKIKSSNLDRVLAQSTSTYNLQKYLDEIILAIQKWIQQQQSYPITTTYLCLQLYQYQEFQKKLIAKFKNILQESKEGISNDIMLKCKLKVVAVIIQLYNIGKKLSISNYFNLIQIKIDSSAIALKILSLLIDFFTLYSLEPSKFPFSIRLDQSSNLKKKLLLIRNTSIQIFEKEKKIFQVMQINNRQKRKKGFVLTQQQIIQKQKQSILKTLKKKIQDYSEHFKFPCNLEFKKLQPEKPLIITQDNTNSSTQAPSIEVLRDFQQMLPGILFQEVLDKQFDKNEKIERYDTDFIKNLTKLNSFKQYDDQFEEFLMKFKCNKRAHIICFILENSEFLNQFKKQNLILLSRFIATFGKYWNTFLPQLSYRLKEIISNNWDEEQQISCYLSRILIIFSHLVNYDFVDINKFLSVVKSILQKQHNQTVKQCIKICYKKLINTKQSESRMKYLLSKTENFKNYD